ncbi:MAG: hypothetical protein ACREP2_12700, partial [Rhodanobacteraceae bacterium]
MRQPRETHDPVSGPTDQLLNPVPGRAFAKKQELAEFVSQELFTTDLHGCTRIKAFDPCDPCRSVVKVS